MFIIGVLIGLIIGLIITLIILEYINGELEKERNKTIMRMINERTND